MYPADYTDFPKFAAFVNQTSITKVLRVPKPFLKPHFLTLLSQRPYILFCTVFRKKSEIVVVI